MNEKGAIAITDDFKLAPIHLKERVAHAFEQLNESAQGIKTAIHSLQEILDDCKEFVG